MATSTYNISEIMKISHTYHKPCPMLPNGWGHTHTQLFIFSYLKHFRKALLSTNKAYIYTWSITFVNT